MSGFELKIVQNPGTIKVNFDELYKRLDEELAEYKGAIFTEETIVAGKTIVADLRKLKEDINKARITAKKQWNEPFSAFEDNMKKLAAKVDLPINEINSQLAAYEEKRKKEKRVRIREIYDELAGTMKEYVPLERIYSKKWENKTIKLDRIKEEIAGVIQSTQEAVELICGMQSDVTEQALQIYKDTLSSAKAITHIQIYEKQKAEIVKREGERRRREEERQRQAEIERVRAEERKVVEREEHIKKQAEAEAEEKARKERESVTNTPAPAKKCLSEDEPLEAEGFDVDTSFVEEDELPFVQPTTVSVSYRVVASPKQLEEVETIFNSSGIYYERRDA